MCTPVVGNNVLTVGVRMTTKDLEIQSSERGLENMPIGSKELYFLTGTGTFAKEPKVGNYCES